MGESEPLATVTVVGCLVLGRAERALVGEEQAGGPGRPSCLSAEASGKTGTDLSGPGSRLSRGQSLDLMGWDHLPASHPHPARNCLSRVCSRDTALVHRFDARNIA